VAEEPEGVKPRRARRPRSGGAMTPAEKQRRYRRKLKMKYLMEVNATPEGWVPEYEGQRPPFGPGNQVGVRHGSRSPQVVDPMAADLAEQIVLVPGLEYLREPRNALAVDSWAHARARVLLLRAYCAGKSIEDCRAEMTLFEETAEGLPSSGMVRRYSQLRHTEAAWRELERAEKHEMGCADRIGLSPLSRMKLGKMAQAANADLALVWSAEDDKELG
jgi:hypothetical protein